MWYGLSLCFSFTNNQHHTDVLCFWSQRACSEADWTKNSNCANKIMITKYLWNWFNCGTYSFLTALKPQHGCTPRALFYQLSYEATPDCVSRFHLGLNGYPTKLCKGIALTKVKLRQFAKAGVTYESTRIHSKSFLKKECQWLWHLISPTVA